MTYCHNTPLYEGEIPDPTNGGVANRRVSLIDRDESVHLSPPCDHTPRHWLDSAGGHPHGHQVCTLVCTDIHTNIISRCTHTYEPQNRHTITCSMGTEIHVYQ